MRVAVRVRDGRRDARATQYKISLRSALRRDGLLVQCGARV